MPADTKKVAVERKTKKPFPPVSEQETKQNVQTDLTAFKSLATGHTFLLESEDAKRYEKRLSEYYEEFKPVSAYEKILVDALANHEWRLARTSVIERGLLALGRREFASLFAAHPPADRERLAGEKAAVEYAKHFRLLKQQRTRLDKYRARDLKELRGVQYKRAQDEMAELERAAKAAGRLIVFPKSNPREGLQ